MCNFRHINYGKKNKAECGQWSVVCIIYNLFICTKRENAISLINPVTLRSRLWGLLSLPLQSMPFLSFSVLAENNFSNSEKVGGFPSLGELQQIVCERRKVLRTWRLWFVWRWCSRGSSCAEGSLAAGGPVWRRRRVTRSQCFVRVLARCPVYEPLQCGGEGRTQSFGRQTANQRSTSFTLFLKDQQYRGLS